MLKTYLLICLLILPIVGISQVLPKEGSGLNFRLVGFSFPAEAGVKKYTIEIAEGHFTTAEDFRKNVILSHTTDRNAVVLEVPEFGKTYTWRAVSGAGAKSVSVLHHFFTLSERRVDTSKYRLRILQPSTAYTENYVMLDGGALFYDTKGSPVAFLPEKNGLKTNVRAMAVTSDSSITLVSESDAYDVTIDGGILWKAPRNPHIGESNDGIYYHHDFVKKPDGHYLVMGNELLFTKEIRTNDTSFYLLSHHRMDSSFERGVYGCLIEFDASGKVIWHWRDAEKLVGTDYDYCDIWAKSDYAIGAPVRTPGLYKNNEFPGTAAAPPILPPMLGGRYDPHSNSFWWDERNSSIYMTYRNLNRTTKIDYPSGKVSAVYGDRFKTGIQAVAAGFFCHPHGIRQMSNGRLCFFNNNSCTSLDSLPAIIEFSEPARAGADIKVTWRYECKVEGANTFGRFGSGGNVAELRDGSFFACMGNQYGKVFIVNRKKVELWSAVSEVYPDGNSSWQQYPQYRATFLGRRELEALIWKAELN